MPVQRIPRYVMLLGELLRFTPERHPDRAPLEHALREVKALAQYINEEAKLVPRMKELAEQLVQWHTFPTAIT